MTAPRAVAEQYVGHVLAIYDLAERLLWRSDLATYRQTVHSWGHVCSSCAERDHHA